MHNMVGNKDVVVMGLNELHQQLTANSPELHQAISDATGATQADAIEAHRNALTANIGPALESAQGEESHEDVHYVSRFDLVGFFQSALAKVFSDIPDLQGYGDKNASWITTLLEEDAHRLGSFFRRVHTDRGNNQSLWQALVKELLRNPHPDDRSPFPAGIPTPLAFPDNTVVAVLGDWGGDNPSAKRIADIVIQHKPEYGIHLGDIYYGGTESECETFLRLWPLRQDSWDMSSPPRSGKSFALNGNHEMYSGGEYYFNMVLPAFGQPQSFFCLENSNWRLIGLDTAYNGGSLKPSTPGDPIAAQWNWLIERLRDGKKLANIFFTHHQPVSAHAAEQAASAPLRAQIEELLAMEGIGKDAIFGWFFGHEHRCALYEDSAVAYNARLVGNGCIPHMVQTEKACEPGCTPVEFFNKQQYPPNSGTAVSSFAKLEFGGPELAIYYCNEDNGTWGAEVWNANKGRMGGSKFVVYDNASNK